MKPEVKRKTDHKGLEHSIKRATMMVQACDLSTQEAEAGVP